MMMLLGGVIFIFLDKLYISYAIIIQLIVNIMQSHLTQTKEVLLAREAECQMERKLEREFLLISFECWAFDVKHLLLLNDCFFEDLA